MAVVTAYTASIAVVGGVSYHSAMSVVDMVSWRDTVDGLTSIVVQALLWSLATAVYRYFFHPLRKYPGPFSNAISEIPAVAHLVGGKQHAYIKELHDKYGAFRLPRPRVVADQSRFRHKSRPK